MAGVCLAAPDKEKPAKTAPKVQALKLPKDAVQVEQFAWRHKDAEGKVWIYRQTPFGLVRLEEGEETAAKAKAARPLESQVQAVEDGDEIRFERPGPFGKWRWTRKKTDTLTGEEREALERAQKSSKDPAPKAKE
jgi:hypothetical protein